MKSFFKKLFLFVLVFISIIAISFSVNKILIANYDFLSIDNKVNKIILGASRTACAINEKYLTNSYNVSASADKLIYSKIKLRLFKNNNSNIDTVILSLDNRKLKKSNDFHRSIIIMESRIQYYSYYFTASEWKHMLGIDVNSTIISLSFVPKFTLKLLKSIIFGSTEKSKYLNIGGYQEVKHIIDPEVVKNFIKNDSLKNYKLSKIEIINLKSIVEFCKSNNTELIFINPPLHPIMYNSIEYQEGKVIFDEYLRQNFPTIPYLDFSNDFLQDSCYADLIHLNKNGAKLFSKKLDSILKTSKK